MKEKLVDLTLPVARSNAPWSGREDREFGDDGGGAGEGPFFLWAWIMVEDEDEDGGLGCGVCVIEDGR